ncbi:MAG: type II toxin-antitoxin system VapC family toxin [Gemmatimonadetes bacterium]|nr:type II toxin-antitoxin system VapC family toxin [Gemmatimonadota bacterium]
MPVWRPSSRPDFAGPALLDTHVWVWMLEGDLNRLSHATAPLLERCAAEGGLVVCDISFWEVGVKAAKGTLTLSVDAAVWLRRAERAPGVTFLPLDRDLLVLSTRLPETLHGDPADRMLVAASQLHALPLVTADKRIITYARGQRSVAVCDARA